MADMSDSERTIWALAEQVRGLVERLAEVEAERDLAEERWVAWFYRATKAEGKSS